MPGRSVLFAAAVMAEYSGFGPATLWFEEVQADNRLVPYGDVRRRVEAVTLAIRSDGSRAVRRESRSYHHWFIPEDGRLLSWIRLDAPGRRWEALNGAGTVDGSMIPPLWAVEPKTCGPPLPPQYQSQKTGETEFDGMRAERWESEGFVHTLVPRLGCGAGEYFYRRGSGWIPDWIQKFRLLRIKQGEPDPALFLPPPR